MALFEAILFGIVQGITEFLPISSTAHIVITEHLLGYHFPGLGFEIFLHQASILAVILYYRKELYEVIGGSLRYIRQKSKKDRVAFRFMLYLLTTTVLTGVLGVFLKDFISESMKTPGFIAVNLVITGALLIFIERVHQYGHRVDKDMGFRDALIVGMAQTLAVMPGISRSGATLVAGLWAGLSRETAVKYSFLLAIPVILGSSVLAITDLNTPMFREIGLLPLALSFIVTFIFSLIGIIWLIDFLKKSRLLYFALYCFFAALMVYLFLDPSMLID